MKKYINTDPWKIVEDDFMPENYRSSESLFSIGNGMMGQRASFEETYSGEALQGSYIAGIYYPDKTRVGWWKNGYPEYFGKIINSPDWIGFQIIVDNEILDLHNWSVNSFQRILDMRKGLLSRQFVATSPSGKSVRVHVSRFLSMYEPEIGTIRYEISPVNFTGNVQCKLFMEGDVKNEDSNYDEKFWDILHTEANKNYAYLLAETKKTRFRVAYSMNYHVFINDISWQGNAQPHHTETGVSHSFSLELSENDTLRMEKYVSVLSSFNHTINDLKENTIALAQKAEQLGFDYLLKQHQQVWSNIWEHSDIEIEGDLEAQQAIRFNIFQLNQTYTGSDARLNIGPKGFTGEKYGGLTYWDTEAYCLPFFLRTATQDVSRNLLIYRYKHLQKAIENAQKLGFTNGAALFPMVTINGEECHNEWEITFEEIHRNGAIAYAIYNYITYTDDHRFLIEYGLETLIAIARFWSQRVTLSPARNQYMILGVTGPNEYENNVNNNWYTNKLACWCLNYTVGCIDYVKKQAPDQYQELVKRIQFDEYTETSNWLKIVDNFYIPYDSEQGIFLQQDGYMDKEQLPASAIPADSRPINQHWSWDRILRSCFIKQADVLQGIYLFEKEFSDDVIRRNFEFYESRTVHESSLSPCIHSILASRIGDIEKAYELYLRTSRLDLDDYNNEVDEGLHITSMAGTWMSIVEGFGGLRIQDNQLTFHPQIPEKWRKYAFKIRFRGAYIKVTTDVNHVTFENLSETAINFMIFNKTVHLDPYGTKKVNRAVTV
ncbi:MAG: glycoside hydrolase family 65 protein [Bacteroidetes bacterium]|jgi:maltose phosphorylase|nr:glycoside hydrolase family 65 protein [Bacteroidota bacterium]